MAFDAQDRHRWDHADIAEARALLGTTGLSYPGRHQLQAAIAAVLMAPVPTPWQHVAGLHRMLLRADPSPVNAVHHAVAVGRARGPDAGLALLRPLLANPALDRPTAHAAHADLLQRAGAVPEAAAAWRRAIDGSRNPAERAALQRRLRANLGSTAPHVEVEHGMSS